MGPRQLSDDQSEHGRRFVRSIWAVMLVKDMTFCIELWQETSPGYNIMNQRVREWVLDTETCEWKIWSPRYDRNAGNFIQKVYCCFTTKPAPIQLRLRWNTTCSEIWVAETSTIQSALGNIGLSLVWTYERTLAGPELCRWWRGNGGGASWLKATQNVFLEGIRKLVDRWTKCVAKQGDCVEK
jgi:hypothetical protein